MIYDFNSPDFRRDPYPLYATLRERDPFYFDDGLGMWVASRHADLSALLRDRRLGRGIEHIVSREALGLPARDPKYAPFDRLSDHSMFDKEPPDHTRLRGLVHKAFTPRRIDNLRAHIQAITDNLLDAVRGRASFDLLEDFAVPLPVIVIAELLGVPEPDRHKLRPWSRDIVAMYELNHTPQQADRAIQAAEEFSAYLRHLADQRLRDPQDDLITALATVEEAGEVLTEDELVSTCVLLLNAGHEATVNVFGNGMWALFQHPDQLARLRAAPDALAASAIEEMMRYDTPLQLFRRWVLEDMTFQGAELRQGQQVALLFGAANRDPARFDQPDALDVSRADNPHLSFSLGIHYCLGAPLARMELHTALTTLLRRVPDFSLDYTPQFRDSYVIRGLHDLIVRVGPAGVLP
jgi:cytochrome P450